MTLLRRVTANHIVLSRCAHRSGIVAEMCKRLCKCFLTAKHLLGYERITATRNLPFPQARQHLRILLALPENSRCLCYRQRDLILQRAQLRQTANIFRPNPPLSGFTGQIQPSPFFRPMHFDCISVCQSELIVTERKLWRDTTWRLAVRADEKRGTTRKLQSWASFSSVCAGDV